MIQVARNEKFRGCQLTAAYPDFPVRAIVT
jgi:hypothetical protein